MKLMPLSAYKSAIQHLIAYELEGCKEYNMLVERTFQKLLHNLATRFNAELASLPQEQHQEAAEWYSEDACNLEKNFPQLLRRSTFIALYSFLEQHLLGICRHYERQRVNGVQLEDLRHEGIVHAQVYLEKVVNVAFPSSENSWQEILKYNKLRNWLVHVGPRLGRSSKAQRFRTMFEQMKYVSVAANDEIELAPEYCENVIEKIENFFQCLFKVLPQS